MTLTRTFADLHTRPGGFLMPNAWDAGSAAVLEAAGFDAIATTSGGIAFSMGRQDYAVSDPRLSVSRAQMFARMAEIAAAVDIPVNGDLEAGWGDSPEAVAETVRMAIDAGLAGGNIEDKVPMQPRLYDEGLAVARIAAAAEVIRASGTDFVLTARCDAIAFGGVTEAVRRSNLYLAAGAGCAFTPGTADAGDIRALVDGIDGPLNLVLGLGSLDGNAHDWLASGVQRVSLGGTLARACLGFLREAATELKGSGGLGFAARQFSHGALNDLFARDR